MKNLKELKIFDAQISFGKFGKKKYPKDQAGQSMSGMVVFRVSCSDNPRNFHERLGVLLVNKRE